MNLEYGHAIPLVVPGIANLFPGILRSSYRLIAEYSPSAVQFHFVEPEFSVSSRLISEPSDRTRETFTKAGYGEL
jgi:hypothetical protein